MITGSSITVRALTGLGVHSGPISRQCLGQLEAVLSSRYKYQEKLLQFGDENFRAMH